MLSDLVSDTKTILLEIFMSCILHKLHDVFSQKFVHSLILQSVRLSQYANTPFAQVEHAFITALDTSGSHLPTI